jgi:hypothetical protein
MNSSRGSDARPMSSSSTYDYGMAPAENRLTSAIVQSAGITDRIRQTFSATRNREAQVSSLPTATSEMPPSAMPSSLQPNGNLGDNLTQLSTESQVSDEDWLE